MANFWDVKMSKDLKAYEQPHDPPFLGDIRPTKDYPAGTRWGSITDFEIWNGVKWEDPRSRSPMLAQWTTPQNQSNFDPAPDGLMRIAERKPE